DFDYIDDQAILESQIENGKIKIAGESFGYLILPNTHVISAKIYNKIEDFVNSGGMLITLGGLPNTGMTKEETNTVNKISDRLKKSKKVINVNNVPDVIQSIKEFLDADLKLDNACPELMYVHRQKNGKDIYFISNSLDEAISREITLRCTGSTSIWHPTTGEIKQINSIEKNGKTIIRLNLKPFEGVFIVFN
ncbi:MAG: glycosyl hydrolase, partial [Candidatus Poribacteria bacterium]